MPGMVGSTGQSEARSTGGEFVLELFRVAHAARRTRLAVENGEVDSAGIELGYDDRCRRDLDVVDGGHRRMWALSESEPNLLARVCVVAVDEDAHGCHGVGLCGLGGHAADVTPGGPRLPANLQHRQGLPRKHSSASRQTALTRR